MSPAEKIKPAPGQESVWDYPRPPRVEPSPHHIQVYCNGELIAETKNALRVLETSHPPVYYIPPDDLQKQYLTRTSRATFCEFKGQASYYTVKVGDHVEVNGAWYYALPTSGYRELKNHVAFYPSRFECLIDGERVQAQPGDFYGGWITKDIVGPFKGDPGTLHW
jgi:uncharacterized protein (DUF427 family)